MPGPEALLSGPRIPFAYPRGERFRRTDPDETEGRRLYRVWADDAAWRSMLPKRKVTLRDSDTHPKDGDVKQAPLVSGAGRNGIAQKAAS